MFQAFVAREKLRADGGSPGTPPGAPGGRFWPQRTEKEGDLQKMASPYGQKCENGESNPGTT